ncbi:S8 family peptidase [Cytobacillus oceanisediminis]|uniref:S8 family peptidase n=1 Tax=Cytobacillus oceanisediminis TaxID=665099 RepID=UPI001FB4C154|nr:S8 family peptidase [Cytobacillus oceanisediminis]UOE58000.1 S8 family peptidase [Cytobacillus oceanisediminis]
MEFKIQSDVLEVQATMPGQVIDWGVSLVQAPQMWSLTKGEGIKVAVLDTGIDINHPDLKPNLKMGMNFTSSIASDFGDRNGHGTHCAGIIAGCDNHIGVVGVAPQAELYVAKVLGDDGSGTINGIIKGIDWAISQKVDIISMSLGASMNPGTAFHDAMKRARAAGIVLVAASGNENTHVGWPAAYDEVIAVGAINQAMDRANFSNYGKELAVVAPGVDIYSTYPVNRYAKLSGTSMATPMVAGVIALIQAYSRRVGIKATPEMILQMIKERSVDLGTDGTDALFGNGLSNVYKAIKGNNPR